MEAEVVLLEAEGSNREKKWGFSTLAGEVNRVNSIALAMMVVTLSQYLFSAAPLFMLGHLSELALSSASIATSLCNATGFLVLFGMASALETLCGQAYGAEQYDRVGTFTCGAILCLLLVCIPVSLLWIYMEKLLILIGQDPLISAEAGKFAILLIPALFPYAILESLVRYLQAQSLILPMFCSSIASPCFQLPLCWAFIFKLNLGNAGAALSIGLSYWFNVILLVLYVKCSPTCRQTHLSFSNDVFLTMRDFFQIAIPSAVMFCLEGWTFELVILLSGVLPNPQLETSVLTICYMITGMHGYIPYSIGAAASTRVSNELGAGKPEAARVAVYAVLVLSVSEFLLFSISIYTSRRILGYAFSGEKEVVDNVKEMVPFLCISFIVDSLQVVLSGVVRARGWQHIGAYVNLGAYYLVGIPVSLILGFVFKLKGEGLWSGLLAGGAVQALSLFLITALTDWEKQAVETRQRIFGENFPAENQYSSPLVM